MKKSLSIIMVLALVLSMVPVLSTKAATEPVILTSGTNVTASPADPVTYTWTAVADGTLTVTMGACSPGWRYTIYDDSGNTVGLPKSGKTEKSADFQLTAGTGYTFKATGWNSSAWEEVTANITYTLSFLADQGEPEVEIVEYAISETTLATGNNALQTIANANTTIYVFTPAELGVYTFTAPAGAILGYWGAGSWFLSNPNSTTNTYEWTCTGLGQCAYIGISNVNENFNLNIEKTGDYVIVEIPIIPYENKATLSPFSLPEGAKLGSYIDVAAETTYEVILGDDGYYHLDSADGPVILVDLNYMDIVLSAALNSDRPVMYAYVTDEEGNTVKYDIGNAIVEYEKVMDANGYYPLTEDLILFYNVYGNGAGVYTYYVSEKYNPDNVWLYCMRTVTFPEVTEPSEPEATEPEITEPSEPEITEPSEPEITEPVVTEPASTEPIAPVVTEPAINTPAGATEITSAVGAYIENGKTLTYSWTASDHGTLTVTMSAATPGWRYEIVDAAGNTVGLPKTGKTQKSAEFKLTAASLYSIKITGWDSLNQESASIYISYNLSFVSDNPVDPEPTEPTEPEITEPEVTEPTVTEPVITEPSEPVVTEPSVPAETQPGIDTPTGATEITSGTGVYIENGSTLTYTWTASANGTLTVSMSAATPGWRYEIVDAAGNTIGLPKTGKTAKTAEFSLVSGNEYTIRIIGWDSYNQETASIYISYNLSFVNESGSTEIPKVEKYVSSTILNLGSNTLTLSDNATYTLYKFVPTEIGTYTITVPYGYVVGYWGASTAYLVNPNSNTNTIEYVCANVGPWAYFGVTGSGANFALNITLEKAEEPEPTEPTEPEPTEPEITEPSVPALPSDSITVNNQSQLQAALSENATCYIVLGTNINVTNKLTIPATSNITLDLNGYKLSGNKSSGGILEVAGTLMILDSSASGTGTIENTATSSDRAILTTAATAYVVLKGGNIISSTQAIRIDNGGTFLMEGGTVTAKTYAIYIGASCTGTITGGTATVTNSGSFVYPLYCSGSATVSVTGGYFNGGRIYGSSLSGKISGGYFTSAPTESYIATGCELQDNDDSVYIYKIYDPTAIPEDPEPSEPEITETVDRWNLVLDDDLTVNFYVNADPNAQISVSVADDTMIYNASDLALSDDGKYIVTVNLAAAQMTDAISVSVIGSDAEAKTYTIRQYADVVLADSAFQAYHALIKEMLAYGSAAQVHFGYNTDRLADTGITGTGAEAIPESTKDYTVSGKLDAAAYYGTSLICLDKITVRFYFTGDLSGCTLTDDKGNTYVTAKKNDMTYVDICNIMPQDLDQQISITVTDAQGNTLTITYGPMNYIVRMGANGSDSLKAMLKALYNYHLAAEALRIPA